MNNLKNIGPEGMELKCWNQKYSREVQHALWAYLVCCCGEKTTDLYVMSVGITHSVLLKH